MVQAGAPLCSGPQPYLDGAGKIQTKRVLKEAPPRELIPDAVLKLEQDYHNGVYEGSPSKEKLYQARRVLRRYHLLQPTSKLKYVGKDSGTRKRMRIQHAREYYRKRRAGASGLAMVFTMDAENAGIGAPRTH